MYCVPKQFMYICKQIKEWNEPLIAKDQNYE